MADLPPALAAALSDRYTLERELGRGGMATVYLARDVKHDRPVALKVLHPDLGAVVGADRFLSEIRVTANLQHPHILPLHDSGSADGLLYYVMPYVNGESLRARLRRVTQLPVGESVRLATEVADALEYAHRKGVVHRDIKPENILVTAEGHALVADFGIALAMSAAGGGRMTATGMSIGTPQYMSPEQAMGERNVDVRTDVYSLGCVLYEMLAGEPPFTGPNAQAVMAKVITERAVPVAARRDTVPPAVNAAVQTALAKVPADRFPTAAAFAAALQGKGTAPTEVSGGALSPSSEPRTPPRSPVLAFGLGAALTTAAATAALLLAHRTPHEAGRRTIAFTVELPRSERFGYLSTRPSIAFTPDGSTLLLPVLRGGVSRVGLRHLEDDSVHEVRGTEGATSAAASPDGEWLACVGSENGLFKVPMAGGPPQPLAPDAFGQAAWAPGAVVFTPGYEGGLSRVSPDGGTPTTLTTPNRGDRELGHWWPDVLPDGDHVLFTTYRSPLDSARVEVVSLATGKRSVVLENAYFGRYVRSGHLLFMRRGTVMAMPFDAATLRTSGSAVPVLDGVDLSYIDASAGFAVSNDGTLAWMPPGLAQPSVRIGWRDAEGRVTPAVDTTIRAYDVRASPKRGGLVVSGTATRDLWTIDERGIVARVTHTPEQEGSPVWSRDGRDLFYAVDSVAFNIARRPADGSGAARWVVLGPEDKLPSSVSPDGRKLFYTQYTSRESAIWEAAITGDTARRLLLSGPGGAQDGQISPNGRWLAFQSAPSGKVQVFIVRYEGDSVFGRRQVSRGEGSRARWAPDGRHLYFWDAARLMRASVDPATGETGSPEVVLEDDGILNDATAYRSTYDVGPDGRLVLLMTPPEAAPRTLHVVVNWLPELERVAGKGGGAAK